MPDGFYGIRNEVRFMGLLFRYTLTVTKKKQSAGRAEDSGAERRSDRMKGYYVADGYMGYVDGRYMLFASDSDYYEYMAQ